LKYSDVLYVIRKHEQILISNLCCEWQYRWYYCRLHEQVM